MAKKKQQPVEEKDKVFKVFPGIHIEMGWPIGWENEERYTLENNAFDASIKTGLYTERLPQDYILHETLNSFKGDSDNLKAFLFLDTADLGGIIIETGEETHPDNDRFASVAPIKGTLVILKGYYYAFHRTFSKKRRVLELVF